MRFRQLLYGATRPFLTDWDSRVFGARYKAPRAKMLAPKTASTAKGARYLMTQSAAGKRFESGRQKPEVLVITILSIRSRWFKAQASPIIPPQSCTISD